MARHTFPSKDKAGSPHNCAVATRLSELTLEAEPERFRAMSLIVGRHPPVVAELHDKK
jgi:hypothetical protein